MSTATLKKFCLIVMAIGTLVPPVFAQQIRTISAVNALDQIQSRFGAESVRWVSEMRATGGQPQPLQWDIVAYDSNSPGLLHHFRASSGIAQDGGPDTRRYPNDAPNGFFAIESLGVDSVAAFTIAEAEARKAKLGFDSCDYFLRAREFSNETVWKLELVDANHRLVGSIFISGTNGAVLRTVWVTPDPISGYPKPVDSMAPGSRSFTGITDAQPPLRNPLPGQSGIAGMPPQPFQGRIDPYAPVSPDGTIQPPPVPSASAQKRTGIFREFPAAGGGGQTQPVMPAPSRPIATSPPIPAPEVIATDPLDPIISGPPVNVPRGSTGSTERIPPPPVPR